MKRFRLIVFILLIAISVAVVMKITEKKWVMGWKAGPPLNVERSGAGAAVVGGNIYVVGGGRNADNELVFLRDVEWAAIDKDGNPGKWNFTAPLGTQRGFVAVVAVKGYIYAIGGANFDEGGTLLRSVEAAKINTNGTLGPWRLVSPMTTPRRGASAVVGDGYIYVIGGFNGVFLQNVERAKIGDSGDLGPWELIEGLLTTNRYIHAVTAFEGKVYALGGHNREDGSAKFSAEWTKINSDGSLDAWHETPPLNAPRFLFQATASGGYLFVAGGFNMDYLKSVEKTSINKDGGIGSWSETTPLSVAKAGSTLIADGRYVYSIGGSNREKYLNLVEYATLDDKGELGYID
ncbi:MAG: hypothetical protein AAB090_00945 [Nitrospirota bacterium]